jgi:hypothetical protein
VETSNKIRQAVADFTTKAVEAGEEAIKSVVDAGQVEVSDFVRTRLEQMAAVVESSAKSKADSFLGIKESAILTFVHDKRTISGTGAFLFGIFLAVALPNGWGILSIPFFITGLVMAYIGYVWPSKVDIVEGEQGVVCIKGAPDKNQTAKLGRNWELNPLRFIPFRIVTKSDQIVEITVANFTRDFASVKITLLIVFRVTDKEAFITNTSPALAMKIMQTYARYIALRIITSVVDARVKFVGRDDLVNIANELNRLLEKFGITVLQVKMPAAENGILVDLEGIRIEVKETDILRESKPMHLEAAVKAVEGEMRKSRKNALVLARSLGNENVTFESKVSVAVNATRQQLVIYAQKEVTTKDADLRRIVFDLLAKIAKAEVIESSIPNMKREFDLRLAQIKQMAAMRMLPKQVVVLDVQGIGTGVGFSMGNELLKSVLSINPTTPLETPAVETSETQTS